jgi:hypothetical protein
MNLLENKEIKWSKREKEWWNKWQKVNKQKPSQEQKSSKTCRKNT